MSRLQYAMEPLREQLLDQIIAIDDQNSTRIIISVSLALAANGDHLLGGAYRRY